MNEGGDLKLDVSGDGAIIYGKLPPLPETEKLLDKPIAEDKTLQVQQSLSDYSAEYKKQFPPEQGWVHKWVDKEAVKSYFKDIYVEASGDIQKTGVSGDDAVNELVEALFEEKEEQTMDVKEKVQSMLNALQPVEGGVEKRVRFPSDVIERTKEKEVELKEEEKPLEKAEKTSLWKLAGQTFGKGALAAGAVLLLPVGGALIAGGILIGAALLTLAFAAFAAAAIPIGISLIGAAAVKSGYNAIKEKIEEAKRGRIEYENPDDEPVRELEEEKIEKPQAGREERGMLLSMQERELKIKEKYINQALKNKYLTPEQIDEIKIADTHQLEDIFIENLAIGKLIEIFENQIKDEDQKKEFRIHMNSYIRNETSIKGSVPTAEQILKHIEGLKEKYTEFKDFKIDGEMIQQLKNENEDVGRVIEYLFGLK